MEKLSRESCKIANRVSLSMVFAEASGVRLQAQEVVRDAFDVTAELLNSIDPVALRNWFEQFESVFASVRSQLIDDPVVWSRFLAKFCDALNEFGVHQKTIAVLGDELAMWEREAVKQRDFLTSLDGLATLLIDYPDVLGDAIERQAGNETIRKRRAIVYSHAVCGIMLVLVSINRAIDSGDPRSGDCAAMATFGAKLTCTSVDRLFEICNLTRV